MGDLGRPRAVSNVLVDDLSGDSDVGGGPGVGANGSSEDSGSELHCVGGVTRRVDCR